MFFNSDNQTGASEKVLNALVEANLGATKGYGNDQYSKAAEAQLQQLFNCELKAYFVTTGTVANCLALASMTRPWNTILSHRGAHVALDESTAPEFFTNGARITTIGADTHKLSGDVVDQYFEGSEFDFPHNPTPRVLSITQSTESGLVYTADELKSLRDACNRHDLLMHVDGARFANAVAATGSSPAELSHLAGVDVLCLGATKCGALAAEAVVFFNLDLAVEFEQHRKRAGQLLSKGRLLGAQFMGWLDGNHWLDLAAHANYQARELSSKLSQLNDVNVVWPTEANQVFVTIPSRYVAALRDAGAQFYDWYPSTLPPGTTLKQGESYIRLVTSFETSKDEIENLVAILQRL